ncbi:Signal transduction histidine kinase [Pricia antarctica]|uniref:histidine kinase n=1 Tax=Pricia antarctica TaxID=641691 RepID=A0A1G6Z1V8_9FLAO|nr:hybrid sensor histidine kinase/response regulator [Pricia antarctica]SDD96620.1 Signal transduction histidine kinase [Pricia antarctica]
MRHIRQYSFHLFFVLAFLLCGCGLLQAQLVITENLKSPISLRSKAELFVAGTKSYSIDQIIRLSDPDSFEPLTDFDENLGFSKDNFWMRFQLKNQTEKEGHYYLETARPITDIVTLYIKDGPEKITSQKSGDAIPFGQKSILHRKSAFRIDIGAGRTIEAYIHIKSDGEVVMLPLKLVPEKLFLYETYKEQLFYGFFYGILVLACIIYLFFYFAMRDTAFVYYGLYVLFIALLQFSLDGLFHQYILPDGGYFSKRAVLFAALISLFFFVNYGRKFLDIKNHGTYLLAAFEIMSGITFIVTLALLAVPGFLAYCYPLANHIGLAILLLTITSIVFLRIKKVEVDRFFMLGISFLILGFVVFILNNLNLLPNSFITENGAKFGIGLEIIFLSLSMGNRIRNLRESNEKNQLLALQRLEDMNDMKSSFISNISHELRTPLNLIMGVAETLRKDKRDKDLQEKCQLILNSSETLLGHVDDIIDFTSIEKGEQELDENPFDLHNTLNRVARINQNKAQHKNIDFTYTHATGMPEKIIGDRRKLIQVLNNLLDNAVKFTSSGKVSFHVDHRLKKDASVGFVFSIQDTGSGISKEKMSTIYESFTKNSSADKREFYGLGLGLYVAKSYVDLQNGNINIQNAADQGTVCRVELEFKIDVSQTSEPEDIKIGEVGKTNFDGCRILLVEDNKMNQMVVKLAVKQWQNIHLEIANHGGEAMEMLKQCTYDIILMDLQMPVMDGFEATANIRSGKAGEAIKNIPILVLTADATDATKKEVFRLGANDYMTKPVKADLLCSKIRKNLVPVGR